MCTVTWLLRPDGYDVFFNRDERRTRGPEGPVERSTQRGVGVLAPRDGDCGGTWIAVNELGLGLGLLNGYFARRGPAPREPRSRGLLVLDVADAAGADEVATRLGAGDLGAYEPFVLAAFEPGAPPLVARWDGRALEAARLPAGEVLLSSSGLDHERAETRRRALLEALLEGAERPSEGQLEAFHRSHGDDPTVAPCMHREDAETRSSCRMTVDPREVRLRRAPGPPCRTAPRQVLVLARRPRAGRPA